MISKGPRLISSQRILKTLEKGLKTSKTVMSGRRLGMILRKNQVHLTKRRQRWFHVLKKLRLCKYYVLADVEFTMIYCARPASAKDFYIGRFPVTQTLWKAIMGTNPSYFQGDDLPVEQISWEDERTEAAPTQFFGSSHQINVPVNLKRASFHEKWFGERVKKEIVLTGPQI